jgi:hypothetical protein
MAREDAPTDAGPRLEHDDAHAVVAQPSRRRETSYARPDDDDVSARGHGRRRQRRPSRWRLTSNKVPIVSTANGFRCNVSLNTMG